MPKGVYKRVKKSKGKKVSAKKAGKTARKVAKKQTRKTDFEPATPVAAPVAETRNLEPIAQRGLYNREIFDSRGSVLEHLAHVMIIQAETVKSLGMAASSAPSYANKVKKIEQ
jgi:hypothetical protein